MASLMDAKKMGLPKKKVISETSDFRKQLKVLLESLEKSVINSLSDIFWILIWFQHIILEYEFH